ncbi:hypothetical protein VP1G_06056 [Cytospora mali]|uniref:Uncharacterized protein n=1 Tax=Cytospora mali TaxID=578113 RepID=A0A194V4G4_CYTMA|nr:hypothetical protein VP1G_06056 [Valsa mali var. pyri (nom. inval.)]
MAENEIQNWAEIEAGYWTDTMKTRAEEDRSMNAKFEARTGPIRQKLTELVDERERLSLALQEVKKQYEAVEAQLDNLGLQFEEAKQVTAADRERKDESARAWFNYNKSRNMASQGDDQPQQNGDGKARRGSKASKPNGHVQASSNNGFSAVNGSTRSNGNGNGNVSQPASADSSPLSEPPDVSPPDMLLTGAEIFDTDGNRLGAIKRIHLENRFTRQIVQLPVQRHVVIRPGRKFTQETMDSIYEPSDAKGAKWLSCMIQATGEEQDIPCTSCLNRAGTWVGCVIVGGEDFPRCANCEWNRQGCSGSSYHQDRSKDPDLQQNSVQTASNSPYPDYPAQASREDTSSGGFTPVNGGAYHRPPVTDAIAPSSVPSKRTSLPGGKKGGRKSLPNMATSGRDKENVEPNDESMLADEGDSRIDAVDPGPEITKETLVLKDNGVEYTEPEIMCGVPLERITPEHPYWDPKWEELDQIVQQKLDSWKKKLEECLSQNKNRFLAGRQVNRGTTTMTFLNKTDFHPYQLVGKKWITKGLVSYDTIFRLAQVIEELPKLGVNCTPVEWVRQRMHELYVEQGESFSLARTVHELYHDPKLRALRTKAGFGNIGRPSGVKKGMSSKEAKAKGTKDPNETPTKKRRRPSSGSVKQELKQEEQQQGGLGAAMTTPRIGKKQRTAHGSRPGSSRANGLSLDGTAESPSFAHRPKARMAGQTDNKQDGLEYDGYTSTDSYSHDNIMAIDFRITQLKTRGNATNMNHTQYWHWVSSKNNSYLEHQVLRTVNPPSWGVYKEPLNFNICLKELELVEYSPQNDCLKIVVRTKPVAGVDHRGDVMALFKRERTLKRFLHFLGEKGVTLVKKPSDDIEQHWSSMESTVLPHNEEDD